MLLSAAYINLAAVGVRGAPAAPARWDPCPGKGLICTKWGFLASSLGAIDQDLGSGFSWSLILGLMCFAEFGLWFISWRRGRNRELCFSQSGVHWMAAILWKPLRRHWFVKGTIDRRERLKKLRKLFPGSSFSLGLKKALSWSPGWPSLSHEKSIWKCVDRRNNCLFQFSSTFLT